jgi:hypothetical protein
VGFWGDPHRPGVGQNADNAVGATDQVSWVEKL